MIPREELKTDAIENGTNAAIVAALRWLRVGIAVVDPQRRLLSANAAAAEILAQATHFRLDGGHVVGTHQAATRAFVALLTASEGDSAVPSVALVCASGCRDRFGVDRPFVRADVQSVAPCAYGVGPSAAISLSPHRCRSATRLAGGARQCAGRSRARPRHSHRHSANASASRVAQDGDAAPGRAGGAHRFEPGRLDALQARLATPIN
jgi:hypothetical protein